MRCTSPNTVGYYSDGVTLCWSPKKYSRQYATFQLPCGKCASCRLENARQTAVRCVNEASLYENNSFITVTYRPDDLKSDRLLYSDAQNFIKRLRSFIYEEEIKRVYPWAKSQMDRRSAAKSLGKEGLRELHDRIRISVLTAGEYGGRNKRPHFHFLVFNWRPKDCVPAYKNGRGDQIYNSETLTKLWPTGFAELGDVNIYSAGYCARYALKKLTHGKDGEHDFEPISRRSTKHAIGKRWIEKNWRDVFTEGQLSYLSPEGEIVYSTPPRYYEKWFKKTHPEEWKHYVTQVKPLRIAEARAKEEKITLAEKKANFLRSALKGLAMKPVIKKNKVREKILEKNVQQLREFEKL